MTAIQVHVEESTETTVEITTEVERTIEMVREEQTNTTETGDHSIHLSREDIEDYEASQAKFRELWEKKREKVRNAEFGFKRFRWKFCKLLINCKTFT